MLLLYWKSNRCELCHHWWHRRLSLLWRHNGRHGVSNPQPHGCFLNCSFRRKSKKTSKLRVTGIRVGNSPVTGEFPAQMASNAQNVSVWWRHDVTTTSGAASNGKVGTMTTFGFHLYVPYLTACVWPVDNISEYVHISVWGDHLVYAICSTSHVSHALLLRKLSHSVYHHTLDSRYNALQ